MKYTVLLNTPFDFGNDSLRWQMSTVFVQIEIDALSSVTPRDKLLETVRVAASRKFIEDLGSTPDIPFDESEAADYDVLAVFRGWHENLLDLIRGWSYHELKGLQDIPRQS